MAPQARAKNSKPTIMFCGKHVRPVGVPSSPRDVGVNTYDGFNTRIEDNERYERKLENGEKRGECICDYQDYPELRKERGEMQKDDQITRKPFPFMKLIAELRNNVYEHMFSYDEAIEFCPEPCLFTGHHSTCKKQTPQWVRDYNNVVVKYHKDFVKDNIAPFIGLLRANKTICQEATGYLYSNEFRFSNSSAWVALDHFFFQIGLDKCAMLRKLTVCPPTLMILPASGAVESAGFPQTVLHTRVGKIYEKSFEYRGGWYNNVKVTAGSRDPILVLEKAGKLRHLRLTVPVGMASTIPDCLLDPSKFESLTITVAQLLTEKDYRSRTAEDGTIRYSSHMRDTDIATESARIIKEGTKLEINHERHFLDAFGRYPMITESSTFGKKEKEEAEDGQSGEKEVV